MNPAELALYPFERPGTLAELCRTLSARAGRRERTVLLAGGTDWIVERRLAPPEDPNDLPLVLDVSRLAEMRGIAVAKEIAAIGAAATFLEIRSHAVLSRRAPAPHGHGARGGRRPDPGARRRWAATSRPRLPRPTARRRSWPSTPTWSSRASTASGACPLTQFFTGYRTTRRAEDEVIVRVEFALPRTGAHQVWRKVGTRAAQAISKVALAAVAEVERGRGVRAGFGMASVAPVTRFPPDRAGARPRAEPRLGLGRRARRGDAPGHRPDRRSPLDGGLPVRTSPPRS